MKHHGHGDAMGLGNVFDAVGGALDRGGEGSLDDDLLIPVHVAQVLEGLHRVEERHGGGPCVHRHKQTATK